MRSDGRIEKRVTVEVPVRVAAVKNALIVETTTMVNLSRLGARVLTSRRWRPGEQVVLTSLSGEILRQCKVIYCHPVTETQFCAGLEFDENARDLEGPSV